MATGYQGNTSLLLIITTLIIKSYTVGINLCLHANACYESLITDGYTTTDNPISDDNEKICTAFEKCVFNTTQQVFSTIPTDNSGNQSNNTLQNSPFFSDLICKCSVIRNRFLVEENPSSLCQKMKRADRFEVQKSCRRHAHLCLMTQEYTYENVSYHNTKYCGLLLHCVPDVHIDRLREMMTFPRSQLTSNHCPNSDFCLIRSSKLQINRCSSCSCDYDCGKTRSCCYEDLDTYNIADDTAMTCQTLTLDIRNTSTTSVYVVNTCGDDSPCDSSIVAPAVSLQTYRIYVNADCAQCNCLQNYTVWDSGMSCPEAISTTNVLTDAPLTASSCSHVLFPPREHLDLIKRLTCPQRLFDECKYVLDLESVCKTIWAPLFSNKRPDKVYRNPHCARCDADIGSPVSTPGWRDGRNPNMPEKTFLVILNHDVLDPYTKSRKTNTETCIQHQGVCRRVMCPEISIRIDRTCQYIYKQWKRVTLSVQLRLRPLIHNHALTPSNLNEMSQDDLHKWLHPKCNFLFPNKDNIVHVYMRYFSSDDRIVVRQIQVLTVYRGVTIVPGEFITTLKTCLQTEWDVMLNGTTYSYAGQLVGTRSINHQEELRELALDDASGTTDKPTEQFTDMDEMLLDTIKSKDKADLIVTKLFLCEQIDLASFEVKQDGGYIVLLHNGKHLRAGEYKTVNTGSEEVFFKVCLEDFLHGVERSVAHAHLQFATVILVISGVVAVFINDVIVL